MADDWSCAWEEAAQPTCGTAPYRQHPRWQALSCSRNLPPRRAALRAAESAQANFAAGASLPSGAASAASRSNDSYTYAMASGYKG